MKSRTLTLIAVMTLFAALAVTVRLAAQEQLPHYTVIDLGTVDGGFGAAADINNRGWVADSSTVAGGNVHAFLWRNGVLTDLGTLGGLNSFEFEFDGVNERGQVVGEAETSTLDPNGEDYCGFGTGLVCLGFIWQNRVMTALPTLGGNNGEANGINNRGQIVGQAETPNSDPCSPFFLQTEAAIWQDDQVQELPPFPGDSVGFAIAINDQGQVVGSTGCVPSNIRAVLWQNGTPIDLGNLGGVLGNFPMKINNRGQVVGSSDLPGDTNHHAFLWTERDGMRDLGLLPGDVNSLALGINSQTHVVGKSDDPTGNSRAFLWQDSVMTDMNTLIPANSPFYLIEALGINDGGQITGTALVIATGEFHGFLATPCGEGDESCGAGEGENAMPQTSSAVCNASSRTLPPSLLRQTNRLHLPDPAFGPKNWPADKKEEKKGD